MALVLVVVLLLETLVLVVLVFVFVLIVVLGWSWYWCCWCLCCWWCCCCWPWCWWWSWWCVLVVVVLVLLVLLVLVGVVVALLVGWISVPRSHLVRLPRSHPDIIAIKLGFYSTVLVSMTRIGFYCSPFPAYIAKCCKKVAQDTASFCSLPADWTDRMEICRLLSLVACAIRVGGALKMTKWLLMISCE